MTQLTKKEMVFMKKEYFAPEFEYKRILFLRDALNASDPESEQETQSGDPDLPPMNPDGPNLDF